LGKEPAAGRIMLDIEMGHVVLSGYAC
jgi:hypothetical protein